MCVCYIASLPYTYTVRTCSSLNYFLNAYSITNQREIAYQYSLCLSITILLVLWNKYTITKFDKRVDSLWLFFNLTEILFSVVYLQFYIFTKPNYLFILLHVFSVFAKTYLTYPISWSWSLAGVVNMMQTFHWHGL